MVGLRGFPTSPERLPSLGQNKLTIVCCLVDILVISYLLRTVVFSYNLPSLKLTAKAPENGWLEDDPFLLGPGLFAGAFAASFRECSCCSWCFMYVLGDAWQFIIHLGDLYDVTICHPEKGRLCWGNPTSKMKTFELGKLESNRTWKMIKYT